MYIKIAILSNSVCVYFNSYFGIGLLSLENGEFSKKDSTDDFYLIFVK